MGVTRGCARSGARVCVSARLSGQSRRAMLGAEAEQGCPFTPPPAHAPHVSAGFALTRVIPPFSVKLPVSPLHELHIGTILSPVTLGLITCAPSVALFEHPETEHSAGHDLPE